MSPDEKHRRESVASASIVKRRMSKANHHSATTSSLAVGPPPEEAKPEKEEKKILKFAKLVLPHVGLVLFTMAYSLCGALLFLTIEHPHEMSSKSQSIAEVRNMQQSLLEDLWQKAGRGDKRSKMSPNEAEWKRDAAEQLNKFVNVTMHAFEVGRVTYKEIHQNHTDNSWTLTAAIFFTSVVMTTIGYGNLVPRTTTGRVCCIIFALFGVPLALVTIADLGKFVAASLAYGQKYCGRCRTIIENYVGVRLTVSNLRYYIMRRLRGLPTHMQELTDSKVLDTDDTASDDLTTAPLNSEQFQVSSTFLLVVLLSYTAFGAALFSSWEDWSFIDACYYCFITITTVGFGDLVPSTQHLYVIAALVYIIFGLVLATMCIDLVGSHYISRIHYFGRKIHGVQGIGALTLLSERANRLRKAQRRLKLTDAQLHALLFGPYVPFGLERMRWIDEDSTGSGNRHVSRSVSVSPPTELITV